MWIEDEREWRRGRVDRERCEEGPRELCWWPYRLLGHSTTRLPWLNMYIITIIREGMMSTPRAYIKYICI